MKHTATVTVAVAALVLASVTTLASQAHAQSREDKRASLVGLTNIAFRETGVAPLGGGTAGSPYALQVEKVFKAAGIHVSEFEGAAQKGVPVYELTCTSVEASDATVRVACESRLLRTVSFDGTSAPKNYAITWVSPMVIATFDHDRVADLEKLTGKLADSFMEDWNAANPSASKEKKKGK